MKTFSKRLLALAITATMLLCVCAPAFVAEAIASVNYSAILKGEVTSLTPGTMITNLSQLNSTHEIDSVTFLYSVGTNGTLSGFPEPYVNSQIYFETVSGNSHHMVIGLDEIDAENNPAFIYTEDMLSFFTRWDVSSINLKATGTNPNAEYIVTLSAVFDIPENGITGAPVDKQATSRTDTTFSMGLENFDISGVLAPYIPHMFMGSFGPYVFLEWHTDCDLIQPALNLAPTVEGSWVNDEGVWKTANTSAEAVTLRSDIFTLNGEADFTVIHSLFGAKSDSLKMYVRAVDGVGTGSEKSLITGTTTQTVSAGKYYLEFVYTPSEAWVAGDGASISDNIKFDMVLKPQSASFNYTLSPDNALFRNGFSIYAVVEVPLNAGKNADDEQVVYSAVSKTRTATFTLIEDPLKVTFNARGGTMPNAQTMTDITFFPSDGVPASDFPSSPEREGFNFLGWFDENPDGLDRLIYEEDHFRGVAPFTSLMPGYTADFKLFARWRAINYELTYNTNGGVEIAPHLFSAEDAAAEDFTVFPETAPTKEAVYILPTPEKAGNEFLGWYESADFSGSPISRLSRGRIGDFTVNAKWTEKIYAIEYNENGGDSLSDDTYTVSTGKSELPTPVKNGFRFIGWYDNADFTGDAVTKIDIGTVDDKVFYAKWEEIMHTLAYEANGGTNPPAVTFSQRIGVTTLTTPTRLGCNFLGWYDNADFSGSPVTSIPADTAVDVKLYAKWFETIYTITYISNGGNEIAQGRFTTAAGYPILPEPTRENFAFLGWYNNEQLTGEPVESIAAKTVAENITLYAKWEQEGFKITYVTNGGGTIAVDTFAASKGYTDLKTPEKPGYNFGGWFDNAELEGAVISGIKKGTYEDVTLYAKWLPYTYSVLYVENGGTAIENDTFAGLEGIATLPTTTREGYTFAGWYDNSAYDGEAVTSIPANTMHRVVLYAKWDIITYKITYHTNGGTELADSSYTIVTGIESLAEPTREGYTFAGWYDNEQLSGNAIVYKRLVGSDAEITYPSGTTGDKEIYAKWTVTEEPDDELSFFQRIWAAILSFFESIANLFR